MRKIADFYYKQSEVVFIPLLYTVQTLSKLSKKKYLVGLV